MLQEKLQNSDEVETKLLSEPELLCFTYLKLLIWRSPRVLVYLLSLVTAAVCVHICRSAPDPP